MAIEITPKPKIEESRGPKIILIVVLILFLLSLISYAILFFYHEKLKQDLSELEKKLEKTEKEKELEERVLANKKLIETWRGITLNYPIAIGVFKFLEENTHPQVWFSDFYLNLVQGVMEIRGQTENFKTLGQQILIFKKQEFVRDIALSDVSISKEGKVAFAFKISLDPKIFRPEFSL